MKKRVLIVGAGPAGLSLAYKLLRDDADYAPIVIEMENKVGGLSRTIYDEDGNGTDIGPHRYHSKNEEVLKFWNEILPNQSAPAIDDILLDRNFLTDENGSDPEQTDNVFLKRRRFSRIFYKKHFLDYPIKLKLNTIFALGFLTTFKAGLSYLKSCIYKLPEINLENFLINRFGKVLYELFFEGYTQKVWGVPPSQISKDWGSQRIKGISLLKVLINAILTPLHLNVKKEVSLIDNYIYPKLGSSLLWDTIAEKIKDMGGEIILNSQVVKLIKNGNKIVSAKIYNNNTKETTDIEADIFVSSMPIKELLCNMNDIPQKIYDIADKLVYRDFILVNFVTSKMKLLNDTSYPTINNIAPDSWIYLQDNDIAAGRLDIMNNFSPYMVKNFKENIVINLEFFCNENDNLWSQDDNSIIKFAKDELFKLNVTDEDSIKTSKVIRIKKAYPSYFGSYEQFDVLKEYIDSLENLYCIGRNGQHKYNNMDHSVLSGLVASSVIKNQIEKNILWQINTDSEYQETKTND